jgi:hypothetical protein
LKLRPITVGERALILHNSKLDCEARLIGLIVTAVEWMGRVTDVEHVIQRAWRVETSMYPSHWIYIDERALWPLRLPEKDAAGYEHLRHKLDLIEFDCDCGREPALRWSLLAPKMQTTHEGRQ